MALDCLPDFIRTNYEVHEWKHASAILENDFPAEWEDICTILTTFRLRKSHVLAKGGGKSPIATALDEAFYLRSWEHKAFDTKVVVDQLEIESPTHKVDCYKNLIGTPQPGLVPSPSMEFKND